VKESPSKEQLPQKYMWKGGKKVGKAVAAEKDAGSSCVIFAALLFPLQRIV